MKRLLVMVVVVVVAIGVASGATGQTSTSRGAERTVEGRYGPYPVPVTGCNGVDDTWACLTVDTLPGEGFFSASVTDTHGQPVFVWVTDGNGMDVSFCGRTERPIAFVPGSSLEFEVGLSRWPVTPGCPERRVKTTGTISVTLHPKPPATPLARAIDDSCPAGQVPEDGFGDVPASNPHEPAVDCVVHWQVASGRSAGSYAPAQPVNREQMASFVARLVSRSGGNLPAASRDFFADDDTSAHEDSINRLAQAGIVGGKGGSTYDPRGGVTRAQMAAFLSRAYDYRAAQAGREALPPGDDYFPDDGNHPLQPEINKAAAAGFTGGFADGTYRPGEGVRRDQMASFLARVLDLVVHHGMARVPAPPR